MTLESAPTRRLFQALLPCLRANGAVEAVEAFNITKLTDKQAGETAAKLHEKLSAHEFKVASAVWGDKPQNNADNPLNGIDDYYLHRMQSKRNHIYDVDINAAERAA